LGYHNRGLSSPYVYGGSDQYDRGHYVADGRFDPNAQDRRLGVMAIVRSLKGLVTDQEMEAVSSLPFSAGDRTISMGKKGADVKLLQELLNGSGADLVVDGDAGRATDAAIRQFQEEAGLTVDGVVGAKTLEALRANQPAPTCSIDKEN